MRTAARFPPGLGRPYEETKRIGRVLELIQLITTGPNRYRRRDLAERFEISERMIQKDLDLIRNALKLDLTRSLEGYCFKDLPRLPAVGFTFTEAISLLLAVETARWSTGVEAADLEAAIWRIHGLFPPEFREQLRGVGRPAPIRKQGPGSRRAQMLALLQRALLHRCKVRIRYSTSSRGGEESLRVVRPYHLLPYVRSWHLIAYCERRRKVLTFKVDRIRKAEPLSERYAIPSDFDLENHLGLGWGLMDGQGGEPVEVELLFEPEAGRWVSEEHWHKTQHTEILASGHVRFQVHLPITPDFVSWVLYYGPRVEVLKPQTLRERVTEELHRAVQRYQSDAPSADTLTGGNDK